MIYTQPHINLILAGIKTQTRRTGKRRWNIGAIHPIKTHWFAKPQGWVRILNVHLERLDSMTEEDARREGGYRSVAEFRDAWERIKKQPWQGDLEVYVIDFCLHDGPPPKRKQATLFDEEETQ